MTSSHFALQQVKVLKVIYIPASWIRVKAIIHIQYTYTHKQIQTYNIFEYLFLSWTLSPIDKYKKLLSFTLFLKGSIDFQNLLVVIF
jgi:hypothetical protein